jgi:hypothetical protein
MERILLQRWFQLTVGGVVAFALGMVVWLLTLGGPSAPIERPDRVLLHGGSPTLAAPVPLTAPEAAAAGWTEPAGECIARQGRFLFKEGEPYVLIYNLGGSLIGMYLYSQKEMPSPPWLFFEAGAKKMIKILGFYKVIKQPDLGFDHWGLSVYFKESQFACGRSGEVK